MCSPRGCYSGVEYAGTTRPSARISCPKRHCHSDSNCSGSAATVVVDRVSSKSVWIASELPVSSRHSSRELGGSCQWIAPAHGPSNK